MRDIEITKADVVAYMLDFVRDPELRAAIEHAREFDPVVARWFDAWDTESEDEIPAGDPYLDSIFARQAVALADRYCKEIVADWLATTADGLLPVTDIPWFDDPARMGLFIKPVVAEYDYAMGGDTSSANARPANLLSYDLSDSEVPFGVIRIVAVRDGVLVASVVRLMNFEPVEGRWQLDIPMAKVFGGRVPEGEHQFYPVPATPNDLSWISAETVAGILDDLEDVPSEERKRVQALLELLRGSN